MIPEIYADGIGAITMSNGVVRIDLVSVTGAEPAPGQRPTTEAHHRVVMSTQAFVQSVGMMQDLMAKLVDAGVIRRDAPTAGRAVGAAAPATADGAAAKATAKPPSSPNF